MYFVRDLDAATLHMQITKALKGNDSSLFAVRTEESSALQYFQVICQLLWDYYYDKELTFHF